MNNHQSNSIDRVTRQEIVEELTSSLENFDGRRYQHLVHRWYRNRFGEGRPWGGGVVPHRHMQFMFDTGEHEQALDRMAGILNTEHLTKKEEAA